MSRVPLGIMTKIWYIPARIFDGFYQSFKFPSLFFLHLPIYLHCNVDLANIINVTEFSPEAIGK